MQLGKSHEQLLQQDPSLPNGGGTRDLRKIETKDPEKLEDIEEMESVVGGTGSVVTGTGSVVGGTGSVVSESGFVLGGSLPVKGGRVGGALVRRPGDGIRSAGSVIDGTRSVKGSVRSTTGKPEDDVVDNVHFGAIKQNASCESMANLRSYALKLDPNPA